MFELMIIMVGGFAIWSLRTRIKALEQRLSDIELKATHAAAREAKAIAIEKPKESAPAHVVTIPAPSVATPLAQPRIDLPTVPPAGTISTSPVPRPTPAPLSPVEEENVKPREPQAERPKKPRALSQWEKTIIENWTGILGAIILVAGIGFLGIYTALKVEAFWRFIMITAVSGVMLALFFLLKRKETWLKLALWLRSSGGATFLFGCLGAGHIPGLQWIEGADAAIALLLLGIGTNLYLGYAGGRQALASLHVVLSVVALAVAPQTMTTLLIASAVTTFGALLAFRSLRWDQHLLITLMSFAAYHLYWYMSGEGHHPYHEKLTGILCNVIIGITAALVHYRKEYESKVFERLPFTVHMVNWGFMGLGAYLNSVHSPWRTAVLSVAALAAFALARRAKKLGINWLYTTDTLIAQTIAMLAVLSAYSFVTDGFMITALLFVEVMVYVRVIASEGELFLRRVGLVLLHGLGAILVVWGIQVTDFGDLARLHTHAAALLASLILAAVFHLETRSRWGESVDSPELYGVDKVKSEQHLSILGILVGLMAGVVLYHVSHESWFELASMGLLGSLFYVRQRWQCAGMAVGLVMALFATGLLSWGGRWDHTRTEFWGELFHVVPLIALGWFVLLRRKQDQRIRWLYISETLTAQFVSMLAIVSARALFSDGLSVIALVFAEVMLYVWVVAKDEQATLRKVGYLLLYGLAGGLALIGTSEMNYDDQPLLYRHATILLASALLGAGFHLASVQRWGEGLEGVALSVSKRAENLIPVSVFGLLVGLLLAVVALHVASEAWFEGAALGVLGSLLYIRSRWQSTGLAVGLAEAILVCSALSWKHLTDDASITGWGTLGHLFPLMVLSGVAIHLSYLHSVSSFIRWPGIYLLGAQLASGVYFLFNPVSPLITGVAWLLLSLGALECANWTGKTFASRGIENGQPERYLLHLGYAYLVGFLVRHVLVDLQAESYLGGLHARLLIECFAIGVALYWWAYRPGQQFEQFAMWNRIQPLFLEGALGVFVTLVLVEIPQQWHGISWAAAAIALLFLGRDEASSSRLRVYSLILSWVGAVHVAAVSSTLVTPTVRWYEESWLSGASAILLLFIYLWQTSQRLCLDRVSYPSALSVLAPRFERINQHKHLWIYYPVVACVAIYLYAGFDKAILTLLWVMEAFGVFVLSVALKEQHFRYMALTGLALCLVRLVAYDLAQSDTLTRAMVFVGVGLIMLLMHSVYNKFRSRFA